jgi:hypothetical protein
MKFEPPAPAPAPLEPFGPEASWLVTPAGTLLLFPGPRRAATTPPRPIHRTDLHPDPALEGCS